MFNIFFQSNSIAIGILVLNSDIDFHILNQNFELDSWNRLIIKEDSDSKSEITRLDSCHPYNNITITHNNYLA